jgi:hypothetical protein
MSSSRTRKIRLDRDILFSEGETIEKLVVISRGIRPSFRLNLANTTFGTAVDSV